MPPRPCPDSRAHPPSPGNPGPHPTGLTRIRRATVPALVLLVGAAVAAGEVPATAAAVPAQSTLAAESETSPARAARKPRIHFGAAGEVFELRNRTNSRLARHTYASFTSRVPAGRMITVGADQRWSEVARMRRGSSLYRDVVRWARVLKNRPRITLLAYSHEPEVGHNAGKGSPADFKRAFRKVVTVFRSQDVRNVRYTWQMTAWAFRTSPSDRIWAPKWYPGNRYVHIVGADAYNWNTCGEGRDRWQQLGALIQPMLGFARRHNKRAALAEFASNAGPRRAGWLARAHNFMQDRRPMIAAAFYFNRPPTNRANSDCRWKLNTRSEIRAYRAIARDRRDFRT